MKNIFVEKSNLFSNKYRIMHKENLEKWQHSHYFISDNQKGEKKTQIVMALTAITMIIISKPPIFMY